MKRLKKHLDLLEKKLAGYEGESIEIKLKKENPLAGEIESLLENRRKYYLLHSFSFLY